MDWKLARARAWWGGRARKVQSCRPITAAQVEVFAGRHDSGHRCAGFSLIEALAAVVVLALAMGIVTLNIARRTDRMSISVLAAETASRARAARELAIRSGQDTVLWVDLDSRTIGLSGSARPLEIPRDIDVEVVSSAAERSGASLSGVRFFPDGASTGATIRLGQVGSTHEIRINWFTGRVLVVPPS